MRPDTNSMTLSAPYPRRATLRRRLRRKRDARLDAYDDLGSDAECQSPPHKSRAHLVMVERQGWQRVQEHVGMYGALGRPTNLERESPASHCQSTRRTADVTRAIFVSRHAPTPRHRWTRFWDFPPATRVGGGRLRLCDTRYGDTRRSSDVRDISDARDGHAVGAVRVTVPVTVGTGWLPADGPMRTSGRHRGAVRPGPAGRRCCARRGTRHRHPFFSYHPARDPPSQGVVRLTTEFS